MTADFQRDSWRHRGIFTETVGGTEGFPIPLRRVVGKWNTCNLGPRAKFSNISTQDVPSEIYDAFFLPFSSSPPQFKKHRSIKIKYLSIYTLLLYCYDSECCWMETFKTSSHVRQLARPCLFVYMYSQVGYEGLATEVAYRTPVSID